VVTVLPIIVHHVSPITQDAASIYVFMRAEINAAANALSIMKAMAIQMLITIIQTDLYIPNQMMSIGGGQCN